MPLPAALHGITLVTLAVEVKTNTLPECETAKSAVCLRGLGQFSWQVEYVGNVCERNSSLEPVSTCSK